MIWQENKPHQYHLARKLQLITSTGTLKACCHTQRLIMNTIIGNLPIKSTTALQYKILTHLDFAHLDELTWNIYQWEKGDTLRSDTELTYLINRLLKQ